MQVLKGMLERRMSTKNLTGPIGMGSMAGEAAREGRPGAKPGEGAGS